MSNSRQKVLVLYLKMPTLESEVIAWATYDGTGKKLPMTGDSDAPPYPTGLDALLDGWRLSKLVKVFLNSQVKNLERPI